MGHSKSVVLENSAHIFARLLPTGGCDFMSLLARFETKPAKATSPNKQALVCSTPETGHIRARRGYQERATSRHHSITASARASTAGDDGFTSV